VGGSSCRYGGVNVGMAHEDDEDAEERGGESVEISSSSDRTRNDLTRSHISSFHGRVWGVKIC